MLIVVVSQHIAYLVGMGHDERALLGVVAVEVGHDLHRDVGLATAGRADDQSEPGLQATADALHLDGREAHRVASRARALARPVALLHDRRVRLDLDRSLERPGSWSWGLARSARGLRERELERRPKRGLVRVLRAVELELVLAEALLQVLVVKERVVPVLSTDEQLWQSI